MPRDADGDGIPDLVDQDRDGDGYLNDEDAFPDNPLEWSDLDGDGQGDNIDLDIDGDGISNEYEVRLGTDPKDPLSVPADMDRDGIPDALDKDIDGDEVPNDSDVFPLNRKEWSDTDGDGTGDNSDSDIDGDGIINRYERELSYDPYDNTSTPPDSDRDGIPDELDDDRDNDGYNNNVDAFPSDPTEWADFDGDGIGDNTDTDLDGDGFSNDIETRDGTDPWDKADYPDYDAPVIGNIEWLDETKRLSGMAYDDGRGIESVWLESVMGDRCDGFVSYPGHVMVPCQIIGNSTRWTLVLSLIHI